MSNGKLVRFTCLWYILSFSVVADIPTSECRDLDQVPLIGSKTMWEARTLEEWQVEKAFHDTTNPIATMGELVETKRNLTNPLNAQKLQAWEAGSDKLAMMLNIVLEFS